ncbi:MAG: YbjQ family protein [Candidatus Eisenbacteria sp.]|nr:YbjQ family protein [Candidatus Eisenbacteria bacterium]
MILTSCETVPGREVVAVLGVVKGNTVRVRHAGKDILAGLRGLVGGEVVEYTKLLAESREQSLDRMVAEAEKLGADAIVNIRMATAEVMSQAAEILCYGTAVRLR